jgi:hypothetical protein
MGLEIILPRISAQMAHFPKLRHLYFNLLSYMAEAFPEQVARLSVPQFAMLAASLEYGVRQVLEAEALQAALEATAALGLWHLKAIRAGHPGLTAQQMPSGAPSSTPPSTTPTHKFAYHRPPASVAFFPRKSPCQPRLHYFFVGTAT